MGTSIPALASRAIEQLQFQLKKLSEVLQRDNFFKRQLIENVPVTSTPVKIKHSLGYKPRVFVIADGGARTINVSEMTAETITISSSVTSTVSFLIW